MPNAYREFMALMPDQPLEVGEVTTIAGGVAPSRCQAAG